MVLLLAVAASLYYGRSYFLTQRTEAPRPAAKVAAVVPALAVAPVGAPPAPPLAKRAPAGFSEEEAKLINAILAHFATGDFIAALKIADEAAVSEKTSKTFHAWLLEQLPVLLTSAGWAKLKFGDCEEATGYLRRSEALKRSPETAKGLAVCYYKQKNLAGAREQFSFYLEKQPGDAQMQLLYTDVLESEGRFDDAVRTLEQLVAAGDAGGDPDQKLDLPALKQRLASMHGRAKESTFQQVETSRNFRLAYRAGDHEDVVSFVLQTLEDALDEYVEQYGFRPPVAPIEVNLYPAETFQSIVVGGPEWAEGLFDGRLRIPIRQDALEAKDFGGTLRVVLRHELVHALLALLSDNRALPPWFDEGLAQRLSCTGQPCARFMFEGKPGGFLAEQAFQTPYISLSAINAGRAYRQSLYLVKVLERQGGDDVLRRLVSAITSSSELSSDGLLKPASLTFKQLRDQAASWWQERRLP